MKILNTRTYIALGLVSLVSTVLLAASFFGLIPDRQGAIRDGRVALAESLAASSTAILNSADPRALEEVLRFVQKRNPELLSAGLRSREGKLVLAVGDHLRGWVPLDSPGAHDAQIQVNLQAGGQPWGQLELRFTPLTPPGILGLLYTPSDRLSAQVYWGHPFRRFNSTGHTLQERGIHFSVVWNLIRP